MSRPPRDADSDGENALARELFEGGAELAGASVGAAIGLIGGPVTAVGGAAAGAIVGRALRHVGAEIQRRMLGPRERIRIGAAASFAAAKIKAQLDAGRTPRDDGFFETRGSNRPAADDLLEGVLQKARDAYEEKKVPLLGNLYANLVFHPEIDAANGAALVSLAGELTYTQLVALAVGRDLTQRPRLRQTDYRNDGAALEAMGLNGQGLVMEIYGLYQRGLLNAGDGSVWISVPDVNPGLYKVQGAGGVLASLMQLDTDIPPADREVFYRTFHV